MNFLLRSPWRLPASVLFCAALSAVFLWTPPAAAAAPSSAALPLVPLASYWTAFWRFMETSITSQQTMVQVGFVGMCLGLYIIIWKKRA